MITSIRPWNEPDSLSRRDFLPDPGWTACAETVAGHTSPPRRPEELAELAARMAARHAVPQLAGGQR